MSHLSFLIVTLFFSLSAGAAFAVESENCIYQDITYTSQLAGNDECGGHLRPGTESGVIQKHNYCRFLDNASSNDYFGPARTEAELTAFFTYAPEGVTIDRCIQPYSRVDAVDTICGIDAADEHSADVQADNPFGCLLSGNMTSVRHSAVLWRWIGRAATLNNLSETPPQDSLTTLERSDTNNDSLADRSVYTFPMQRKDCRTARTGERVCNYQQFSQFYTYNYSISPAPVTELGHTIAVSLSKSNDAPPFEAPPPLNCPQEYAHDQYYEIDGGTRWRTATSDECPYGAGTRQCEQRVWNHYHCDDGVADVTGSAIYEDTGVCTGQCTSPSCNLPWGGTISNGQSVIAYAASSVGCGQSCASETRTCSNGSLSGSYSASSCSVQACTTWVGSGGGCSLPSPLYGACPTCPYPGGGTTCPASLAGYYCYCVLSPIGCGGGHTPLYQHARCQ